MNSVEGPPPGVPSPPGVPGAPGVPEPSGLDPLKAFEESLEQLEEPPQPPGVSTVQTDVHSKDGLAKCPRCGSTEIALNPATGMLHCSFCRFEWSGEAALEGYELDGPIADLVGLVLGSGSGDIIPSTETVLTFKCSACGAEVVIDTDESMQARCHWCRNKLSMNEQIANGAVPDMVLPFKIPKADAVQTISAFVKKRKFFASRKFTAEFNPENVMGVYFPYMVVDVNAKASFSGEGEHETRSYTVKSGDNDERRYDADTYKVARKFAVHIDDLTVESSSARLDQNTKRNTNNIINSILPFDVENSVKYDSNYLAGFSSERRDVNVDELMELVTEQSQDVARYSALDSLQFYDRGVRWDQEDFEVVGQRWVSAYLPVWLYSYQEVKGQKKLLHYVAVNARTGEVMGSVPINQKRLLLASAGVELVGIVLFFLYVILIGF